ncbi:signal transduction histidine kinase [Croceifilum oryzae]|uniref:histidine kinase n=1 Tax=Croceifilum oryzae TaxID=1553429 RepID=A0AAJ1TM39_9BACL|nr:sensor histidine kinase [Croceifilum oryzae]MDQ0417195.1 signal transduction histidine kinase [Croceifilum oryzae]
MRLFLRDHLPLSILAIIQMLLTFFIFWLEDVEKLSLLLYPIILNSAILLTYLIYRFISLRSFYHRLSKPIETLNESVQAVGYAPMAEKLDQLLNIQFHHYQDGYIHYKQKLSDHITFINQWVHQMKTPISVIELTIQDEDAPIFTSIHEELDRLREGLEMVLYASRLDEFEHDLHVESISLQPLVREAISSHKRLFIRNQVYPVVQIAPEVKIYSDEKWLEFILSQLLTNAVRYSAGSGEEVVVSAYMKGERVVLEITDHGIGIPSKDIRRVFDPFFTGQHGREYRESTGMGLYLVKEICKRLDHQVELESQVGAGTTVRLFLQTVEM